MDLCLSNLWIDSRFECIFICWHMLECKLGSGCLDWRFTVLWTNCRISHRSHKYYRYVCLPHPSTYMHKLLHLPALHHPLKIDPQIKQLGCGRPPCFCSNKLNYRYEYKSHFKENKSFGKVFYPYQHVVASPLFQEHNNKEGIYKMQQSENHVKIRYHRRDDSCLWQVILSWLQPGYVTLISKQTWFNDAKGKTLWMLCIKGVLPVEALLCDSCRIWLTC